MDGRHGSRCALTTGTAKCKWETGKGEFVWPESQTERSLRPAFVAYCPRIKARGPPTCYRILPRSRWRNH